MIMIVAPFLKAFVYRTLERVRFQAYTRPQTFEVEYEVRVETPTPQGQRIQIFLPVIQDSSSQRLLDGPHFSSDCRLRNQDPMYGNSYVFFDLQLTLPMTTIRETFRIHIDPSSNRIDHDWKLKDYDACDSDVVQKYLVSNTYIQPELKEIQEIAQRLKGNSTSIRQILFSINQHVIQHLRYGNAITGLYRADETLHGTLVDCGGFDTLYCSLAIACSIPSRIVSGFWLGDGSNHMHAWVESLLPDGSWFPADPSTQQLVHLGRSNKSGRFGYVGSDRMVCSVGCDLVLQTEDQKNIKVDILQHPFILDRDSNESIHVSTKVHARRI